MALTIFPWPRVAERSSEFTLTVDGKPVDLLVAADGAVAIWDGDQPVQVAITLRWPLPGERKAMVQPARYGITPTWEGERLVFTLAGPGEAVVVIAGLPKLYLLYHHPLELPPAQGTPGVRFFEAGQFYEAGLVKLAPGETLWLAGGAILHGAIRIEGAHGAMVRGRGIVDNRYFLRGGAEPCQNPVLVADADDVLIEGITCIEPQTWTVKTANATRTRIENVRIIGNQSASDGIDITGSRDVVVRGCFVRSDDDCLAVKSVEYRATPGVHDWCRDVENILFEGCLLDKHGGGSAMELGHEFRCAHVRGITFRDIDVLACHRFGSVFSIRHCDDALIEEVLYEDIRVDHHYNELIGFRIIRSRYSKSAERGRVRGVTLRRIRVAESIYNAGYTVSHIGGWDEAHGFEGVLLEDVEFGGHPVRGPDDLDLYVKYCRGLEFR